MVRKRLALILFTVSILVTGQQELSGQEKMQEGPKAVINPREAINHLHEGLLVVRLPGFERKVEVTRGLLARARSDEDREAFTEMLVAVYTDRAVLHGAYMQAMEKEYDFSKVAYIYDHQTRDFLDGKVVPMEKDLATPVMLDEDEKMFLLSFGDVEANTARLSILTAGLDGIPSPFPNHFIAGGINTIISFFKDEHPAWLQVRRMNEKLWRYFGR